MEKLKRTFNMQTRSIDDIKDSEKVELWVEGYAVIFNSPTVIFETDSGEYKEKISEKAFELCDMTDVIFNYNHCGKVIARTRNNTLELRVDEKGLFVRARLDGTEEGRKLYDEISKGYIDRMSFQFTVSEESYDKQSKTWTIQKVKKLYDVSAVDIPAYDETSITARKNQITSKARAMLQLKLKLL